MRYSREHKLETHARIVKKASVRLREKGAHGIGVADLMKDAGLTHGGFYAHFDSREALVIEAFAHAMDRSTERWRKIAAPGDNDGDAFLSFITEVVAGPSAKTAASSLVMPFPIPSLRAFSFSATTRVSGGLPSRTATAHSRSRGSVRRRASTEKSDM